MGKRSPTQLPCGCYPGDHAPYRPTAIYAPPFNGCPVSGFMEPIADYVRYWFAKLFNWSVEAIIIASAFKLTGA